MAQENCPDRNTIGFEASVAIGNAGSEYRRTRRFHQRPGRREERHAPRPRHLASTANIRALALDYRRSLPGEVQGTGRDFRVARFGA
jgi:hypothetical protein